MGEGKANPQSPPDNPPAAHRDHQNSPSRRQNQNQRERNGDTARQEIRRTSLSRLKLCFRVWCLTQCYSG
eukprot:8341604-Alexandrium_andersonii.AAC.1